jgi:hypothetical protein
VTVGIGLDQIFDAIPVQITVPLVEGVGLQVAHEIANVAPVSTAVQVIVTFEDPEEGFGRATHVGATGAVTSSITEPDHTVSQIPIIGKISTAHTAPVSNAQLDEHPSPAVIFPSSQSSFELSTPFPHPKLTFTTPVVVVQLPAASHDFTDTGLDPEVKGLTTAQL